MDTTDREKKIARLRELSGIVGQWERMPGYSYQIQAIVGELVRALPWLLYALEETEKELSETKHALFCQECTGKTAEGFFADPAEEGTHKVYSSDRKETAASSATVPCKAQGLRYRAREIP